MIRSARNRDLWAAVTRIGAHQETDDCLVVVISSQGVAAGSNRSRLRFSVQRGPVEFCRATSCHAAAWNETAIPSRINGIDVAAKLRKCCLERELFCLLPLN